MKRRGRGIACMWYPIGFTVDANASAATVKVNEDGTATVLTGTVETGQGSLTVLGQTRRGVRVVVLDADELGVLLERPLRREVLGMKVVGDDVELHVQHREVEREIGAERSIGRLGVEVAEMRREEGLAAARDAERALELGTGGDDRTASPGTRQ